MFVSIGLACVPVCRVWPWPVWLDFSSPFLNVWFVPLCKHRLSLFWVPVCGFQSTWLEFFQCVFLMCDVFFSANMFVSIDWACLGFWCVCLCVCVCVPASLVGFFQCVFRMCDAFSFANMFVSVLGSYVWVPASLVGFFQCVPEWVIFFPFVSIDLACFGFRRVGSSQPGWNFSSAFSWCVMCFSLPICL